MLIFYHISLDIQDEQPGRASALIDDLLLKQKKETSFNFFVHNTDTGFKFVS